VYFHRKADAAEVTGLGANWVAVEKNARVDDKDPERDDFTYVTLL